MLDDGMGFRLVPWKPVIEQRLGQSIAVTVRGAAVSWEIGCQPGLPIGYVGPSAGGRHGLLQHRADFK